MSTENADSLKLTSYWFFLIIAFFSSKSSYKKGTRYLAHPLTFFVLMFGCVSFLSIMPVCKQTVWNKNNLSF